MKNEIGLWIDHRQAIIVTNYDSAESIKRITSNVGKHVRYAGAAEAHGSGELHHDTTEDGRDRRFDDQLDRYYAEVVASLDDASAILILGPGEAKGELHKHIKAYGRPDCIVMLNSADKMTDNQLVAAVRQHFHEAWNGSNRATPQHQIPKET